jgi:uncharacterized RDD family membrane protein YckC
MPGKEGVTMTDQGWGAGGGYEQPGYPQYPQSGQQYPQPGGYQQPGAYQQPGSYQQPGAYQQPGGYLQPAYPQVPPGLYFDPASGLTIPQGTEVASVGYRIGAYFLAGLLWFVTLFIGYAIWGLISWANGQTPVQQVLGLRCWNVQQGTTATWGTMFLRGLCQWLLDGIAFGGLVSFVMMLANKDRRTLYDHISSVVVLHDPNKVLAPR